MTQQPEFVYDVANGDLGASRHLRKSLAVIRSATTDPELRKSLDDVIAGRTSMRDFGTSDGFAKVLEQVTGPKLAETFTMSEEERDRLAEQGNAILDQLRHESPADDSQQPPRDEPHPDDDFFDERRQTGWLE